jgi:hypothetical protein
MAWLLTKNIYKQSPLGSPFGTAGQQMRVVRVYVVLAVRTGVICFSVIGFGIGSDTDTKFSGARKD